jgi:hypothetical protein
VSGRGLSIPGDNLSPAPEQPAPSDDADISSGKPTTPTPPGDYRVRDGTSSQMSTAPSLLQFR